MKATILLAGLVLATSLPVHANEAPGQRFLHRYDRNGDGRIDAEEYRNFTARLFARRDANNDGVLSNTEHGHAGGGDLSQADFMAQSGAMFAARDSNGDGYLDLAEIAAAREARAAAREKSA